VHRGPVLVVCATKTHAPAATELLFGQFQRKILGSPYTGSCIPVRPRDRSRARSRPIARRRHMHLATRLDRYAPSLMVGSRGSSWRFEPLRMSRGISQARITGASPTRRSGVLGYFDTLQSVCCQLSTRSATWKTPPRGATSGLRIRRFTRRQTREPHSRVERGRSYGILRAG
jgi:hypothetical protein